MKRESKALARYRMNRAKATFKDGLVLLKQGSPNGAIGRFYYAAFHAARALLATKELDASRHTGVIKLFSQHFVKPGLVFPETAKVLSRSFEKRLDSEYEDYVSFSKKEKSRLGMKSVSLSRLVKRRWRIFNQWIFVRAIMPPLTCSVCPLYRGPSSLTKKATPSSLI